MNSLAKLATDIGQTENLGQMWKLYNKFIEREETINEPETPLMRPCGNLTTNTKERCDEFARYMHSVHQTPESPLFDNHFKRDIDKNIEEQAREKSDICTIAPIQVPQLRELLGGTKSGSSPGEDCISYAILKICSDTCLQPICSILNQCLQENIFPKAWKSAKLRMLLKPAKDPTQASSYRPISLLSCLGKLLEKHVNNHLLKELTEKNYFKAVQAGYSKGRSPQEHTFRLSQDVMNGFKKQQCTAGIFLDVKAAFDCVWRNGLKYKIKKIGLSKQVENLLLSFLDDRTLHVFEKGCWSDTVYLLAGTPQGSVLSPILYLIYMNDATEVVDQSDVAVSQYADDIGAWATGNSVRETINSIQNSMNQLERWCRKWFVTLNPLKSQLVVFTKSLRHKKEMDDRVFTVQLFQQNVPIITEAIFLGITFDQRLTWESQFKKVATRAYKRLNLLRRISTLAKEPSPNIIAHLYRSVMLPIFEYGSVCTVNAAESHFQKLQLIQNMALRVTTHSPKYISIKDLHDCTGFIPIKDHLTSFARNRLETMRKNSPILESSIERFQQVRHIRKNRSPLDVLYNNNTTT